MPIVGKILIVSFTDCRGNNCNNEVLIHLGLSVEEVILPNGFQSRGKWYDEFFLQERFNLSLPLGVKQETFMVAYD